MDLVVSGKRLAHEHLMPALTKSYWCWKCASIWADFKENSLSYGVIHAVHESSDLFYQLSNGSYEILLDIINISGFTIGE